MNKSRNNTWRKKADKDVHRQNEVLNSINNIFKETIFFKSVEEVANTCLSHAAKLTNSEFGFVGELNSSGLFDTFAISNPGWEVCGVPKEQHGRILKNMPIRGIHGSTLREGKSRFVNGVNEIKNHPDHVDPPKGHPQLTAFLGVPLKRGRKTIGMIGLANSDSGYNHSHRKDIEALSFAFVEALDRCRMAVSIKESEEHFKYLVEKAHIGILIDDIDGNFTYTNKRYAEMFGYSEKEIKKLNIHSIVHPDDAERVMGYHEKRVQEKKAPSRYEFKGMKKDGSDIYLEVAAVASKKEGRIVGTRSYIWDITERKKLEKEYWYTLAKLRGALRGFILAMAKSVEERDPFTAGHQQRVADLARAVAEEMGLDKEKIDGIRLAGVIHDIGKIKVPAEILSKPSKLSDTEFEIIKLHPKVGYDILKNISFPWPIAQIVHQHHERMDGSGYPQGLADEDILIESRILAVADVVEAMASHRPYRSALGIEKALEEISQNRERLYDSKVVDACLELFKDKKFEFRLEVDSPWN